MGQYGERGLRTVGDQETVRGIKTKEVLQCVNLSL